MISRLLRLFTALALTSLTLVAAPLFPQAPGMVSYTYRDLLKKDLTGTLDTIRALGITDMEFSNLFGKTAAEIRAALDARGMVCSSFGVSHAEALQDTATVAANAKTLGAKFVRVAWVPNRQPFTLATASPFAITSTATNSPRTVTARSSMSLSPKPIRTT